MNAVDQFVLGVAGIVQGLAPVPGLALWAAFNIGQCGAAIDVRLLCLRGSSLALAIPICAP